MPEFRRDPTTGSWTILAVERANRPGGRPEARPSPSAAPAGVAACPFCAGHEDQTPPEILRIPAGASDWSVRVVPNKFPALVAPPVETPNGGRDALFVHRPARGYHEVIVEGAEHRLDVVPPSAALLRDVLLAARERYRVFVADVALHHFALFKNHGTAGGASLQHPHWQLVASPVVPPALERELRCASEYVESTGGALYDDVLARELESGDRVIEVTERFAVVAAYAPQWMGESWIVPRTVGASVGEIDDDAAVEFAEVLRRALRRTAALLDGPPLNVVMHSAPLRSRRNVGFRWHARVQPRLGTRAGFELGSGISIVTLAPEDAAAEMRAVAM